MEKTPRRTRGVRSSESENNELISHRYAWIKGFYFYLAMLFNAPFGFCQEPDTTINLSPITESSSSIKSNSFLQTYRLNYWVEGSIIGIGMTANVLSINRIKGEDDITDEEIAILPTVPVNEFDRWALRQDPLKRIQWDHTSDFVLGGIILLPGLLMVNPQMRHDWLPLLVMFAEAHTVVFGIYNYSFLGPTFQDRFRPLVYYDSVALEDRKDGNNRNSFYSGHVATAAVSTFMMAKVYSDCHPDIGAKKFLLYAAATVPPLALSYLRMRALKHFPSDNMVGLGVGALCGIVIPELHKNKNSSTALSIFTPPEGGAGLTFNWSLKSLPAICQVK